MRKFIGIKPAPKAHPLVQKLFAEMERQRIGIMDMSERSGINPGSFKDWRTRATPRLDLIEAAFNVLGMTLQPVEKSDGQ